MDVLPLDVCNLIVKKLKLDPIARMQLGKVSRLWRQITKQFEDKEKTSMFPWVMLQDKPPMFQRVMLRHPLVSHAQDFMSIVDGYVMKLKFPRITTPSPGATHEYRCGSSNKEGWMVWQIMTEVGEQDLYPHHLTIQLWFINPLTCAEIELPIINQVVHEPRRGLGHLFSIKKAVFSSDPCAADCVVAVIDKCGRVYFCRLEEPSWTFYDEQILDMVFYEGQFLGYNRNLERFMVFEYDHLGGRVNAMVYAASLLKESGTHFSYMLESCGEVLLVLLESPYHPEPGPCSLKPSFLVFKLDSSDYKWVRMDSLGDRNLFVGYHASMSVSSKDFPTFNLKGNCIYFIDHGQWCEKCICYGVYHLEDGRVEPLFPSESHLSSTRYPLLWYFTNPLKIKCDARSKRVNPSDESNVQACKRRKKKECQIRPI